MLLIIKCVRCLVFAWALLLPFLGPLVMGVRAEGNGWTLPLKLSSDGDIRVSENTMVSDQFGYVHAFWIEKVVGYGITDERAAIQHSRFDGNVWSTANDVYATKPGGNIYKLSATMDKLGNIHIVWTEGFGFGTSPIYYSHAPSLDAASAHSWSQALRVDVAASLVRVQLDSKGVIHVMYSSPTDQEPGVYYFRSDDQGAHWTPYVRLDPDIIPGYTPASLQLALDADDGIHALWYYKSIEASDADWVRYIHSFDGGETWSTPFTIDKNTEDIVRLRAVDPILLVSGRRVDVVWAAANLNVTGRNANPFLNYKHHRYSTDAGRTWSDLSPILGDLNGSAGDALAVDGQGRVHFFGQIRFPQAIYHAYLQGSSWSEPSVAYFIRKGSKDPFDDRVHAHNVDAAVRVGNQLVVTFTNSPAEKTVSLYSIHLTLDDVATTAVAPTPTATQIPGPTTTPMPTVAAPSPTPPGVEELSSNGIGASQTSSGSPARGVLWGAVPALLFVAGVTIHHILRR